ncbi:MOSC beta barrel domain protein [Ancylostoma duodenale]|uniref:MOSC beta barrel domain protein n=1 Tax=Ancylostoma duodenale TaxID=51022 RepID=A0A0C2H6B8_9BILA|nr:MOSC beta barrel domain protein [Ancylostoma duodenale]
MWQDKRVVVGVGIGASALAYWVFSFYCDYLGPISGEHFDRYFVVIDGKSGRFYTARQKPVMVTIGCKIADGVLTVKTKDGRSATVDIEKVRKNKELRTAVLHSKLRTDGLDCGDEVAALFSEALGETGSFASWVNGNSQPKTNA